MVFLLAVAGWFAWRYRSVDVEARDLDDAARKTASGSFVRTSAGLVNYELAGPADAPVVVLVHGFSVPGIRPPSKAWNTVSQRYPGTEKP